MIKTILPEDAIDAGLIQGEEREVLDLSLIHISEPTRPY